MEETGKRSQKIAAFIFAAVVFGGILYLSLKDVKSVTDGIKLILLIAALAAPGLLITKYNEDIFLEIVVFTLSIIAFKILSNYFVFHKSQFDLGISDAAGIAIARLWSKGWSGSNKPALKLAGLISFFAVLGYIKLTYL